MSEEIHDWGQRWAAALGPDCGKIVADCSEPDLRDPDEVIESLERRIQSAIESPDFGSALVGRCAVLNILGRPLNRHDVVGTEDDAVVRFGNRHEGEELTGSGLQGVAAAVVAWCRREGLICRVRKLPLHRSAGYSWRFFFLDVYPPPLSTVVASSDDEPVGEGLSPAVD